MKNNLNQQLWGGLLMAAALSTVAYAADSAVDSQDAAPLLEDSLGQPFATVTIPSEIDQEAAMKSCVKTALGRKWNVVKKENQILQINLKQRGWDATVYMVVKEDVIVMYSDSYVVNKKTGERKKKKDPTGWLRNLEKDVRVFMDREAYLE